MAERAEDPRLEALKAAGETVYSYSRLTTFETCLYSGYLGYVLEEKSKDNAWSVTGGRIHEVLEDIVNERATEADLLPAVYAELDDMEMLGIDFPKDSKGGDSLRENWIKDIFNFCQTYKSPKGKQLKTEEMFIYTSPHKHHLVGYIDLQQVLPDGSVCIYDYKSSSMFTKENIKEHSRQLIIYLLGLRQQGLVVREISWIYMKYVIITYMGKKTARSKNVEQITKIVERRKIGSELAASITENLQAEGLDDIAIEKMVDDVTRTNLLNNLPEKVRNKYRIRPYVQKYPIDEDEIKECEEWVDNTIEMWEKLDKNNLKDFPPRKFTKTTSTGKEVSDVFFCLNLCGHTGCPYIHDYMEAQGIKKKQEEENEELFS